MPQLDVRVLGPVEVLRAGRLVALSPKERDLVAVLAAHWPGLVAAARIEDELWEGEPPTTARKIVQKYVSQLRASFGAGHIASRHQGYGLRDVSIDAVSLARVVETVAESRDDSDVEIALAGALELWRGEPYAGVELVALESERARLTELRLVALQRHVEAALRLGRHALLVGRLEQLAAAHPLREGLWAQLIRALYGAGRPSDALRAYRRLRTHLAEELGVEPSPELRALEQQVLHHDPALGAVSARPRASDQRRVMTIVALAVDGLGDDPEDRARATSQQLATVRRICEETGGIIESTSGGRVVVGFGVPALGDDADRGVQAAQRMVAELAGARAGVATGWALVQPEATPGTRVLGAVVDAAWAGVEAADPGSVVVDPSTNLARTGPSPDLPYVGRADELSALLDVVTRTVGGTGPQLVSLVGDAGIGKTRLVAELRRRSPDRLRWFTSDCQADGRPCGPLRTLADDPLLPGLVPDRDEREWLRTVVGGGVVAEPGEVVAACTTLLGAIARAGPTVVVFDDVHRADPRFVALLSECLDHLRRLPLLAITTARPTTRPGFGAHGTQLTLGALTTDDIHALLRHALPRDAISAVQHRALVERSAGNPLYAIQFARMVEQHGWEGSVPATVRSLIAARLDLLAALDADLLDAGAVLGPGFDAQAIAEMLDVDEPTTAGPIRRLIASGLLERAPVDRAALRVSHDLIQEVAYERLARPARERLHQAAARAIERRAGPDLSVHAMRISRHLEAAARAIEDDGRDALALRRRAFDLMVLAGDSLAPDENALEPAADRAEVERVRAEIMCRRGELGRAAETAAAGLAAARAAGDRSAQARLFALIGNIHWLRGDTTASVEALESALGLVAELEPGRAMLDAISNLAFITALMGRTGEAIELAEQGLQLSKEHDAVDKEVRCLNARGAAKLLEGDLAGYDDFTTALARALERGLSHESAMAYHNLGELHWQGDNAESGLGLNRKGLELAERRGLAVATDWLRANRVSMCFDAGYWDEALALAEVVLSQEISSGEGQAGTMSAVGAARIHLWRGELEAAQRLRHFFLPRARRHAVIQQVGPALVVAGLVETATGHPGRGAELAAEFCGITEGTREYRHMELADTVRLLLADGRLDEAVKAADSRVLATARNECQSGTAAAAIAMAAGESGATTKFERAAVAWRTFGNPLEEHLAWRAAGSADADALADQLRLDPPSVLADAVTPWRRPGPPGPGC